MKTLAAALALTLSATVAPGAVAGQMMDSEPYLRVNGSASIEVPSDRANITFAVETQEKTAEMASDANAVRMEAVIAALRGAEIEGLRIETRGYQLSPIYSRPQDNQLARIEEYRVTNHVSVRVDDISSVGTLLDLGVRAGANRIAGLSFEASDVEAARLQAVGEAVASARQEAVAAAAAAGVELGPPLEIQINSDTPSFPMYQARGGIAMEAAVAPPIEGGSQRVSANVTIRYRIGG